jgi:hypothetical protein
MPAHVAATAAAAGLSLACNAEGRTAWHFAETAVSAFEAAAFEARSTAHSGIGLFAVRDICAGERLPCEAPLARWSVAAQASEDERRASFEAMLATLTPETIAAIMELSQSTTHGTQKNLLGTWQTNGLPINYDNGQPRQGQQVGERTREAAVFANVCRLNHACAPNCHHEWNERLGRETVHTVRNVRAGEELTICYLPPRGLEQQARRHRLMANFGFMCTCRLCELRGEALQRSDTRQRAIGELSRDADISMGVEAMLKRQEVRRRLMDKEELPHIWAWKPLLLPLLGASMAELGSEPASEAVRLRAAVWAQGASACVRGALGGDHRASELIQAFVQMVAGRCHEQDEACQEAAARHFVKLAEEAMGIGHHGNRGADCSAVPESRVS